jgi:hypothetical protein
MDTWLAGFLSNVQLVSTNTKELGLPPLFDRDSGSTYNFDIVGSFLDTCINSHERCSVHEPVLPSRVVDLGDSSGKSLRLVMPGGQRGTYACLSYCVREHLSLLDSPPPLRWLWLTSLPVGWKLKSLYFPRQPGWHDGWFQALRPSTDTCGRSEDCKTFKHPLSMDRLSLYLPG